MAVDRESRREILRRARELFGDRLLGLFAFGSRVAGSPRPDSDLDLGVWLAGRIRRHDTWLPWLGVFEHEKPDLDRPSSPAPRSTRRRRGCSKPSEPAARCGSMHPEP